MDTIYNTYNRLHNWIYKVYGVYTNNYINQFGHIKNLEKCTEFTNFKNSTEEFSKLIFILNNFPENVYNIVFSKYDPKHICQKYYIIKLIKSKDEKDYTVCYSNLDDIQSNVDSTFIYIRVELYDHNIKGTINHVNSIIINNSTKVILFFEPQTYLKYNKDELIFLIGLENYTFIEPQDIGYSIFNRLQTFDCFCQTYILYVFILIVDNPHVEYKEYSKMFNSIITTKNIGYFLFYLYMELKTLDIDIQTFSTGWYFPKNGFNKLLNTLRLRFKDALENNDNYSESSLYDFSCMDDIDSYTIVSDL